MRFRGKKDPTGGLLSSNFKGSGVKRVFHIALTFLPAVLLMLSFAARSASGQAAQSPAPNQLLTYDSTRTHFINSYTNTPVFVVGDSPWELISQLSEADALTYLQDRANRGYNAIIVQLIDSLFGNNAPCDINGNCPFAGNSPGNLSGTFTTAEGAAYFAHADYVLQQASNLGITVFLYPIYAGYDCGNQGFTAQMQAATDAQMTAWGQYVGNRYASFNNIVWVIGADANPASCSPSIKGKLVDVATGIKSVDTNHLMAFDPAENTDPLSIYPASSNSWEDLSLEYAVGESNVLPMAQSQYTESGALPFYLNEVDPYENDGASQLNLRQQSYGTATWGANLGNFFGNDPIWCFNGNNSGQCSTSNGTWQSNLSSTGSVNQARMGTLFSSREHWLLVPDYSHAVVTAGYGSGTSMTTTARTSDGQTIISYIPNGNSTTITVNMTMITDSGGLAHGYWFDPSSSAVTDLGTFATTGTHNFTASTSNDWVLVLDSNSANLAPPGSNRPLPPTNLKVTSVQ